MQGVPFQPSFFHARDGPHRQGRHETWAKAVREFWGDEHVRRFNSMLKSSADLLGRPRRAGLLSVFVLALLLTACGAQDDILVPPRVDVTGIQVVAVFPFANDTAQLGLDEQLVDRLVSDLYTVGWYEIVSPERVAEEMARLRPSPFWRFDDEQWMEMARSVTLELDADGYVVGRISDYTEELTVSDRYFVAGVQESEGGPNAPELPPEWRVMQTTEVSVTVSARLVNAHTGAVVHEQRVVGIGRIDDERVLTWSLPSDPPETLRPAPHRRDVSRARDLALQQAFAAFAADILPQLREDTEEPVSASIESTAPSASAGTGGE